MRMPEFASSSRTPSRRVSQAARQALCLARLLVLPGGVQSGPMQPGYGLGQSVSRRPPYASFPESDDQYSVEDEKRLRALNTERQKELVSETNKLLKLAAELNAEVNSAHPDALTADQLRKLAEMEKLAHSVKDKMSTSVRGVSPYSQPFPPSLRYSSN